ncbi:hypothetical protein UFOVP256_26 [uncultured Caudovirales phage]|uniref:Uncharacterized protein n=1 Tax=uncultured Caudovirales phage TaxID=2100421 RepID=A0A6J5LDR1_9CAUD|nr:hypothetical protein UFOVP256_26 [uncultured Caudovirales phage]
MDAGIVLTAAGTVVAVVGSNIALIGWLRADMKAFETKVDGWRSDIDKEMKDFHAKLCVIDERTKK